MHQLKKLKPIETQQVIKMKNYNIHIKPFTKVIENNSLSRASVKSFLSNVAPLYPNFDAWFNFKFYRNINVDRHILIAHDNQSIQGLALLKKSHQENKICTFYVDDAFRGNGIGHDLMSKSLEFLNNDNVIITVSEEKKSILEQVLKSNEFKLSRSDKSMYREGITEHIFTI
jgi:ribosomal protein S18 acetylase RimI-like enzyme